MKWRWDCTWITGASSGIGAALAREIAAPKRELVLSGRSLERLNDVADVCRNRGAMVEVLPFDLGDASERKKAIQAVIARARTVDALINNAGISQRGIALETDLTVDRRILEVDYFAGVELTKAVFPAMVDAGRGCVVAISSIAALMAAPYRSSYNAAKAAQLRFYQTLRNETPQRDIVVSTALVGMVNTEISRNALTGDGARHDQLDPNQATGQTPERVARKIVGRVLARRTTIFAGMTPKSAVAVFLSRWAPRLLNRILAKGTGV